MSFKKIIWNNTHARIWFFVSTIIMVLVFTVTMIATQMPFLRDTLYILWGYPSAIIGEDRGLYECEYNSKEEVYAAANEFNIELASEGFVLLQNKDNSLPLAKSANVSVFGQNSVNLVYGGSGSGGNANGVRNTIFESLTAAGFGYNTALETLYKGRSGRPATPQFDQLVPGFATGEAPDSIYTSEITGTYTGFDDAALVVLSRIGGEGFDLPRTMAASYTNTGFSGLTPGARVNTDHYLQLDANEVDLLLHVTAHFENVILVINSNNTLELGFLDDPDYWTGTFGIADSVAVTRAINRIRAALCIGSPGGSGIMALGSILNGDVNPSGRTVDIYARDFTKNPTIQNFGNNNVLNGNAYNNLSGATMLESRRNYFIEYEEGIYFGYRYLETRGKTDGKPWYDDNVVFPYGHGKSYSDFEWTVGDMRLDGAVISNNRTLAAGDSAKSVSIDVTVKNISAGANAKPGKDVVQLYVEAPYFENGIEKSHVILSDFAKTGRLAPGGDSEKVTLTFSLYDIASYDYNDDNGNGFKGWETEAGEYKIHISRNSHSWADNNTAMTRTFTVPQISGNAPGVATAGRTGFTYLKDPFTPDSADIVNRFDDVSYGWGGTATESKITYLSRADWVGTWPAPPTQEECKVTDAWLTALRNDVGMDVSDVVENPWFVPDEDMPVQAGSEVGETEAIQLYDMLGIPYDDVRWEAFLDQLTVSQMVDLVGRGAFGTAPLKNIGMPITSHSDGPSGWYNFMGTDTIYGGAFYASECVVGATFNRTLALKFGEMVGNEGLIGNESGDGLPYSGWYAPGVNIHRSPFSGRNWEYFSEDPVLSGKMAAQVTIGAQNKGVITFAKHFALNDQETNRSSRGLFTWASEQTMREIYLKAFEILVKEGDALGIMSSYNRIGSTWAGGDYRLLTEVLRQEWCFKGVVLTDFADKPNYMFGNQMVRAGGDLQLYQALGTLSGDATSATHVTALRNAAKNVLYVTIHSNAMNYEVLGYTQPAWVMALIWGNVGLLLAFLAWGAIAIYLSCKKIKSQ